MKRIVILHCLGIMTRKKYTFQSKYNFCLYIVDPCMVEFIDTELTDMAKCSMFIYTCTYMSMIKFKIRHSKRLTIRAKSNNYNNIL
jgi:hypothetical protein